MIEVTVEGVDSAQQRRAELRAGLLQRPARIAPKFFYDEQGSALYGAITALEEYYPPREEAAVFEQHRDAIAAALPRGGQWVDLGCGDGRKAWPWLEAVDARRYVGVDIAEPWLRGSLHEASRRFPRLQFDGVVTDFTRGLAALGPVLRRRADLAPVFFYPGSSIGNFEPHEARALLGAMCEHLGPRGRLLIGVDGVKPREPLVAAYDDALGVTAAFNRNVLRVVNRELDSDFDPAAFDHRAVYDDQRARIEMHLVARTPQRVRFAEGAERRFEPGEAIVTEHSYKHTPESFRALLAQAGFGEVHHFANERGWFHVFVAAPAAPSR